MITIATILMMTVAAAEPSEAARLFDVGRDRMKANDFAAACPAFEKSLALEPALGTVLNLAVCLESQGKTASAYARFNEAEAWATRTQESKRAELAVAKARALKSVLSWVALTTQNAAPQTEATIGATRVPLTGSGVSVPVDPGQVTIEVRSPGYLPWKTTVPSPAAGQSMIVTVPALVAETRAADAPLASVTPPPPPPPSVEAIMAPAPTGNVRGALVGGLVGSGLVVGAGVAGLVWALNTAQTIRDEQRLPQPSVTREQYRTVVTVHPISIAGIAVGAAGVAVTAFLLARSSVVIAPSVGPGGASVTASGSF